MFENVPYNNDAIVESLEYHTADGHIYRFDDGRNRFTLGVSGLGLPDIEFVDQIARHGRGLLSWRANERTVQFGITHKAGTHARYWRNRQRLLNHIRPNRNYGIQYSSGRLVIKYLIEDDDGYEAHETRCLDAAITRGPNFEARNTDDWQENTYTETLRFLSNGYPFWYTPQEQVIQFDNTLANANLDFSSQFSVDWVFDSDTAQASNRIVYNGTVPSYPIIELHGPMLGATITNVTTGKSIEFGYSISQGEVVYINLKPGNKSVSTISGLNLIGSIGSLSSFATFAIEPDPQALGGINDIEITMPQSVDGETKAVIRYYEYYIGI